MLPELANSGYAFRDRQEAHSCSESEDGEAVTAVREAAARDGLVVVLGVCERLPNGRVSNSSILVDTGRVAAVYRKLHLWGLESRIFDPGNERPPVIDTRYGRIGLGICYDVEFPELTRSLCLAGAEILAFPTNWPAPKDGEASMLGPVAMVTAGLSRVYVALCDRDGAERGLKFDGGSVIASPAGVSVGSETGPDEDGVTLIMAGFDPAAARDKRIGEHNDRFRDRRPGFY